MDGQWGKGAAGQNPLFDDLIDLFYYQHWMFVLVIALVIALVIVLPLRELYPAQRLPIIIRRACVAHSIQHGHNDDHASLITKRLRHGRSQPSLGTLCSTGFSLIVTRPARIQHLLISIPLGGPANPSCV